MTGRDAEERKGGMIYDERQIWVDGILSASRVVLCTSHSRGFFLLGMPEAYRLADGRCYFTPYQRAQWTYDPQQREVSCREYDVGGGCPVEEDFAPNPINGYRAQYRVWEDPHDDAKINLEATLSREAGSRQQVPMVAPQLCLAMNCCDEFRHVADLNDLIPRCFVVSPSGTERMWLHSRQPGRHGAEAQWYVTEDAARPGLERHPWGVSDVTLTLPFVGANMRDSDVSAAMTWQGSNVVGQGYNDCLHCEPDVSSLQPGQTRTWRGAIWMSDGNFDDIADQARQIQAQWKNK